METYSWFRTGQCLTSIAEHKDGGGVDPIMKSLKCSKSKATRVIEGYKELYPELDELAAESLRMAKRDGYVQGFFGLKLRTPNIKAEDTEATSKMARSINNMRSQSGSLLTMKAIYEIQEYIEECNMQSKVKCYCNIYDSIEFMIEDTEETVAFVNEHLIRFMLIPYEGQIVANEAELDIGYNWEEMISIKNHDEITDYKEVISEVKDKLRELVV